MTHIDDVLGRAYELAEGTLFTVLAYDGLDELRCRTSDGIGLLSWRQFKRGLAAGAILPAAQFATRNRSAVRAFLKTR